MDEQQQHQQQQQQQQQKQQQRRQQQGQQRRQQERPLSEKMIDLHVYVVPSEIWRDKYNNMDNNDVSESISLGFIRIHPELRVYTLREEIEVQLNSPNLPQDYVFLKSVGRCLTKVKQHQEHQLKAKHFLPQLNSSLKYGNELYILETTSRGSNSSTSNSVLMSSDQRSSSNNDHVTGGRFRYQNGNSKPRNGTNYQLPFLQTSEKLKKLIRVGPPHQTLKHVNPNLFDPPTSNSDASFVSPTYQLGSKLVDDSNYYLDDVATGNMYRTPPSLSLTPTKHQSRRRRRRLHAGLGPRNPTSRNIAGGDDENDDDENDDDDSPMLHSYSEPPYHPHSHLPSAYIHSYPYFIDDMMMLPLSGSPRHTNRRSQHNNNNNKHNNNNNNNNDDIDDDDESNNNNNNNDRRSRSPPTMAMSLPANPSQRSTRRSKEKPKAAEDFTATTTATTTMTTTTDPTRTTITTDGKEGDDESKWNLADEKRLREMRARQELKREQEEQERWERLDSEQQNIELGLIRTEQQQQQQHDGRDSEATNKDRHQQHQSPRAKNEADAREEKQQEGKGEDEKGEDEEGVGGEELEGGVDDEEREEEEDKSAEHDTEQRRSKQNNYRPELNTGAATSLTPVQKTSEPETARSRRKDENEKLYEMLESVREQRKSKERQREELVKRAKSLQAKVQNRRNHARDMWKKKYYEEKKRTSPLEEQCNKQRHELDVIHRKYISSLEPAREKPTKITAKKPSEKNNILIQASRLKHDTDELRRRVDNAKMKLTAELKLRNQTEIELRALKGELIQQKINLNLIRKQQLSNVMNQGGAPATQDILISLKQPIVHTTK